MSFEPGAPVPKEMIPLCVPEIGGNEWEYVKDCLDSGWVSSVGSYVERFEGELAAYVGREHGVATVNGTAALHVALLVAGVRPDDEVLVPALTFIAPVNAIRYAGAWPVLIDAERRHWQMDVAGVERFLREGCERTEDGVRNRATGRRVAAVVPVHVLGHPVDMAHLLPLAREFGVPVVEDATESLGAELDGRKVGSFGEIACFSFNGNKLLTTGSGGMLVTDDPRMARRARYLTTQAKDDPVEYVHGAIGFNYRLGNVQAAMGCAQLERIEEYLAAKRRIAATYAAAFADVPGVRLMSEAHGVRSAWWLSTVEIDPEEAGVDSRTLLRELAAVRIQTRPLWQPIHRSPAHADQGHAPCPVADRLHARCLSLPSSVGLTVEQQERVCAEIARQTGGGARAVA